MILLGVTLPDRIETMPRVNATTDLDPLTQNAREGTSRISPIGGERTHGVRNAIERALGYVSTELQWRRHYRFPNIVRSVIGMSPKSRMEPLLSIMITRRVIIGDGSVYNATPCSATLLTISWCFDGRSNTLRTEDMATQDPRKEVFNGTGEAIVEVVKVAIPVVAPIVYSEVQRRREAKKAKDKK